MKNVAKDTVVKTSVKKKPKKKVLRFIFFGVASCAFIVYFLGLVANVSFEILNKYKEKALLEEELLSLKEEEQELTVDVEKLKDPEYVAKYLREKFLYSKDGEYIIKILDSD